MSTAIAKNLMADMKLLGMFAAFDQGVADAFQDTEGRRAAIDELAVRAGLGEDALHDEFLARAWIDALIKETGVQFLRVVEMKDGLDGAALRSAADERLVGALTENEFQCADDDRFSRAGLAGDGGKPARQGPFQIFHEGEILDPER